jgi:hypothetical protein
MYDYIYIIFWLTVQHNVPDCKVICYCLYSNMWINVEQYVTDCTAICDWLYNNLSDSTS